MKSNNESIKLQNDIQKFIDSHPDGFKEFALMKDLEQHNSTLQKLQGNDELTLFKKHFLIMNALYKLQDFYHREHAKKLLISATKIHLTEHAKGISSQQLSPDCSEAKLKTYYLDWSNLVDMDQGAVEKLLDDFWSKFFALDKRQESLELLGLASTASEKEIKSRFKYLAAQHHPDRGGDAETFIQIRLAYETLTS